MASYTRQAENEPAIIQVSARRGARSAETARRRLLLAWLLWVCVAPLVVGCRGCSSEDPLTEEEREAKRKELREEELKKKEKEKPPFEFLQYAVQPGGAESFASDKTTTRAEVYFKPGHWTNATLRSRANNFDFRGELLSEAVDLAGRPIPLDEVPFQLRTTRPVILPKGQQRLLEFSIFTPVETRAKNVATRLLTGVAGRPVHAESQVARPMPPHQYYLVVLALNPDSYSFLKKLDSVTAPVADDVLFDPLLAWHYRVALPRFKTLAPLPSQPLGWTSIAYVLWDDVEPKKLSPEQQQAMLDWLHWGGQLILSGPETLATLQGSFLQEYLPATAGDTWQLTAKELAPLNAAWLRNDRPLKAVRPWSGVHLKLAAGGTPSIALGEEPLVAERRTGRGRIVLTAFRLSQRELRDWPNFDNFFNGGLLRRPPRTFRFVNETMHVAWADRHPSHDELRVSQVRYFTRDALCSSKLFEGLTRTRLVATPPPTDIGLAEQPVQYDPYGRPIGPQISDAEQRYGSGAAGWNDFSAASNIALDSLRKAAGITVPDARFVVLVLGAYIVLLVPINWAFFRVLGRVEWAWAAAPFISIGGAIAVVYLAQLDIGFARSKSELAVMEVQGGYQRAHLTRYLALYSSLGTRYQLRFQDQSAVALPFATGQRMVTGQSISSVDYRRTPQLDDEEEVAQVTLDGMEISSNMTGMVHSEEMLDAGGGFGWQPVGGNQYRLTNDTKFALEGVGIVGPGHTAWVGSLGAGAAVTVTLAERDPDKSDIWSKELDRSPATDRHTGEGLNLRNFYLLAENESLDETGANEVRVIGWTADELTGLTIRPSASQSRQLTMVVGHLDYGTARALTSDTNSRKQAYEAAGKLPPPQEDDEEEQ